MIILKSIIKSAKQLFSFQLKNSRAEMMMYRLSNINVNRKAAKA